MSRKITQSEFSFAKELIGKKRTIKEVAEMLERSTTCIMWINRAPSYSEYVQTSKAIHNADKKPEAKPKQEKTTDYSGALLSESKRLREAIDLLRITINRIDRDEAAKDPGPQQTL